MVVRPERVIVVITDRSTSLKNTKKFKKEATLSWSNHLMRRWKCLRNSGEILEQLETSSRWKLYGYYHEKKPVAEQRVDRGQEDRK